MARGAPDLTPAGMKIIGLMSGTSADGVDAALVDIGVERGQLRVEVLAHATEPYPPGLRDRVLRVASAGTTAEICHLSAYLGELFAEAALAVAARAAIPIDEVALIGSHGQTVHHLPDPRVDGSHAVRSTLQIGAPAVIAERTGVTTIADFRPRDMAAGGEGAPLTPLVHHLLFTHPTRSRAILNIGGIANVTILPAGGEACRVTGFDTGPGNVLLDEAVRRLELSPRGYDEDGRVAASGKPDNASLTTMLAHPFIVRRPPKSTGRETFGPEFVREIVTRVARGTLAPADALATLTAFTVRAVAQNLRAFVFPSLAISDVITIGGGAANACMMRMLAEALPESVVQTGDAAGVPARAVEAVTFAVLAYLTATNQAGNLPGVTGASGARVLGCIVPGAGYRGLGVG